RIRRWPRRIVEAVRTVMVRREASTGWTRGVGVDLRPDHPAPFAHRHPNELITGPGRSASGPTVHDVMGAAHPIHRDPLYHPAAVVARQERQPLLVDREGELPRHRSREDEPADFAFAPFDAFVLAEGDLKPDFSVGRAAWVRRAVAARQAPRDLTSGIDPNAARPARLVLRADDPWTARGCVHDAIRYCDPLWLRAGRPYDERCRPSGAREREAVLDEQWISDTFTRDGSHEPRAPHRRLHLSEDQRLICKDAG